MNYRQAWTDIGELRKALQERPESDLSSFAADLEAARTAFQYLGLGDVMAELQGMANDKRPAAEAGGRVMTAMFEAAEREDARQAALYEAQKDDLAVVKRMMADHADEIDPSSYARIAKLLDAVPEMTRKMVEGVNAAANASDFMDVDDDVAAEYRPQVQERLHDHAASVSRVLDPVMRVYYDPAATNTVEDIPKDKLDGLVEFDEKTHKADMHKGRVIVRSREDERIDNPHDAAVVSQDGSHRLWARNGHKIEDSRPEPDAEPEDAMRVGG